MRLRLSTDRLRGIVVLALAVTAAAETAELAMRRVEEPRRDPAQAAEVRWAEVRREWVAAGSPGVVGYEGAVLGPALFRDQAATERYYRAQFALSPAVLTLAPAQRWVVLDHAGEPPRLLRR